jgi:lipopolysaccharide/colanic/teichoic acid biosynthesis glycosyltransferase
MTATLGPDASSEARPTAPGRRDLRCKRAVDLALGSLLALLAAPLLAVLAFGLWCDAGPRVLFRQRRDVGRGRTTEILKLRTLTPCADPDTRWEVADADATPFGHWLRASHLDELPQLLNVLRGEMSLVGPRPERPYFAERFAHGLPGYAARQRMPAGLTGWAQVHGLHGDTSIAERARFDNDYIDRWSLRLDLWILSRTLRAALRGFAGARRGGTG